MADEPFEFTLEIEAANAIIVLRVGHVVLNSEEAIERFVPPVQHAFAAITEPHYLLFDITGLVISARMRTYLLARGRGIGPRVQAVLVFSHSDHLTELVLSTSLMYDGVPFNFCADETTARAMVAALRAAALEEDQLA